MKVQVLGSGCPTCEKLYKFTKQAVEELGWQVKVEYVTGSEGIQKIVELGAMSSPVLAIDDQIVMVGFIPDVEKIKEKISRYGRREA